MHIPFLWDAFDVTEVYLSAVVGMEVDCHSTSWCSLPYSEKIRNEEE